MNATAYLYLIPFFLIPFFVFVLVPKLDPLFRKIQRRFRK
jgi:hypothetical protein